jgi:hypothetical protein
VPTTIFNLQLRRTPRSKKKYRIVFRTLDEAIDGFTLAQARELAKTLGFSVRRGIQLQNFRHVKLSPPYKKRKLQEGLDPRILIATGQYVQQIGVQKEVVTEKKVTIHVGVPKRKHKGTNLTFEQLGRIHEFGTRRGSGEITQGPPRTDTGPGPGIPARPHWRPVRDRFLSGAKKYSRAVSGRLVDHIRDQLRPLWTPKLKGRRA